VPHDFLISEERVVALNRRKLLEPMAGVPQVVGKIIHPPVVAGCPPAVSAAQPGGVTRSCRSLFAVRSPAFPSGNEKPRRLR